MPYSAKAVANRFIDLAKAKNEPLDQMKIQKLVYFAHGWFLHNFKKPLLDERAQAWKFGPVIPSLYSAFKAYGNQPITSKATESDFMFVDTQDFRQVEITPEIPATETDAIAVIDSVWEAYGSYSGIALSNLTHRSGTPWEQTYKADSRGIEIDDDVIKQHFDGIAAAQTK